MEKMDNEFIKFKELIKKRISKYINKGDSRRRRF